MNKLIDKKIIGIKIDGCSFYPNEDSPEITVTHLYFEIENTSLQITH